MGRLPKTYSTTVEVKQEQQPPQEEQQPPQEEQTEEVSQLQPLSSVQASLMDFLAESLCGDDMSLFMQPPLIGSSGKGDFFMSEASKLKFKFSFVEECRVPAVGPGGSAWAKTVFPHQCCQYFWCQN